MNKQFFRYSSLTGILALLAMIGLNQCDASKGTFLPPIYNPTFDGGSLGDFEDNKDCFSLLPLETIPNTARQETLILGLDISKEGNISHYKLDTARGVGKRIKDINKRNTSTVADEANDIFKEVNGRFADFSERRLLRDEVPADDRGNRSPLSSMVDFYTKVTIVIADENITFHQKLIEITNSPSSIWRSPIRDVDIDDTGKVMTFTFYSGDNFRKIGSTIGEDQAGNPIKAEKKDLCRYGLNFHVVSKDVIDPDRVPGNADDYPVVTPIIIDPIIKNNGSGP